MRYLVIVEETDTGYSAYSPDLPGCIATAATRAELEREMASAVRFHIEGCVRRDSMSPSPGPRSPTSMSPHSFT